MVSWNNNFNNPFNFYISCKPKYVKNMRCDIYFIKRRFCF